MSTTKNTNDGEAKDYTWGSGWPTNTNDNWDNVSSKITKKNYRKGGPESTNNNWDNDGGWETATWPYQVSVPVQGANSAGSSNGSCEWEVYSLGVKKEEAAQDAVKHHESPNGVPGLSETRATGFTPELDPESNHYTNSAGDKYAGHHSEPCTIDTLKVAFLATVRYNGKEMRVGLDADDVSGHVKDFMIPSMSKICNLWASQGKLAVARRQDLRDAYELAKLFSKEPETKDAVKPPPYNFAVKFWARVTPLHEVDTHRSEFLIPVANSNVKGRDKDIITKSMVKVLDWARRLDLDGIGVHEAFDLASVL